MVFIASILLGVAFYYAARTVVGWYLRQKQNRSNTRA